MVFLSFIFQFTFLSNFKKQLHCIQSRKCSVELSVRLSINTVRYWGFVIQQHIVNLS